MYSAILKSPLLLNITFFHIFNIKKEGNYIKLLYVMTSIYLNRVMLYLPNYALTGRFIYNAVFILIYLLH